MSGEPGEVAAVGSSFDCFYELEFDGQVRRAFLLTGSNESANDVVHDAMLQVFRRWGELDAPGGYLNIAVLNGCRQVARRRAAYLRMLRRLPIRRDSEPVVDLLDDLLARLPFNQRAAVVLRYYAGMSTAQIADALGCSPGSVGPWITRALRALREELS